NQYLETPNDPQLNIPPGNAGGSGDFSFDAWVKIDPNTNSSGVRVIVEKRTANPYKGYSFYLYNRYLGLQLADASGFTNYGAPSLVVKNDGQWHFVAVSVKRQPGAFDVQFTYDPDKYPSVHVYSPARAGDLTNSSAMRIGMLTIGTGSVFNGSMDEVEFFNRAVSSAEWLTIQSAGCYGKCDARGARLMQVPDPLPPGNCTWDPIQRIWTNCTL
ncbi:MAG: LamG domain-containing protein, partial [Acidobacteriota bacterium]|nr:LamG domain-containing protein [Acidobacteriota bacterium]